MVHRNSQSLHPGSAPTTPSEPGTGKGKSAPPPAAAPGPAVVIVGASVRAWAASAHRAGFAIHAADLFADRDLAALGAATAVTAAEYPAGLLAAADGYPPGPWCYTGALENHPDLIDQLAARRPLAGNHGPAVRRVRSHRLLAAALADSGLRYPATRSTPAALPTDGSWLSKPVASAGGRGIVPWVGAQTDGDGGASGGARVWQERISGTPVAASYVLGDRSPRWLGASRQLIGVGRWQARPFAYCGSVDMPPTTMGERQQAQWERIGAMLEHDFGLCGAVGVDAIETADGELVVIEVNPRPTASMELFERRSGESVAARHLAIDGPSRWLNPAPAAGGGTWAKAVVRTPFPVKIEAPLEERFDAILAAWTGQDGWPALADIPRRGTAADTGMPLLTVFAVADSATAALRVLDERTATIMHALADCRPPESGISRPSAGA